MVYNIDLECREAEEARRERNERIFYSSRCYMCDGNRTLEYEDGEIENCPICNRQEEEWCEDSIVDCTCNLKHRGRDPQI